MWPNYVGFPMELEMGKWGVEKEEDDIKDALCEWLATGSRKEEKTLFSIMWSSLLPGCRTRACFFFFFYKSSAIIHLYRFS